MSTVTQCPGLDAPPPRPRARPACHGRGGTTDDALRLTKAHRPKILVLDLNIPGSVDSSLDILPALATDAQDTRIVILTMQEDPQFARRALAAGANAYVLQEAADAELVEAVRRAAGGEVYLNPRLGARLAAAPPEPAGPPDDSPIARSRSCA